MSRSILFASGSLTVAAALLAIVGCSTSTTEPPVAPVATVATAAETALQPSVAAVSETATSDGHGDDHVHQAGAHGGIIVSLGRDSYHVEAIVTNKGELRLYTLGSDESRVMDVEHQKLVAYVKPAGGSDSAPVELTPQPQPGDAKDKASLFAAQLPDAVVGKAVDVTVPNITISGERFRLGFTTKTDDHADAMMPSKVADEAEKQLYLTPGGRYTEADIQANGRITASQKFVGFKAKHDLHPKPGDKICPVTQTKANPACTWIIGGKTYEFCCPPCVDNFLELAKNTETAKDIKDPEYYVKK